MSENLYSIAEDVSTKTPFLTRDVINPNLFGPNNTGLVYSNLKQQQNLAPPIDVIDNFPWTKSPKSSREDVPEILLKEKRIINNSSLANFFYSILAGADILESLFNRTPGSIQIGENTLNIFEKAGQLNENLGKGLDALLGEGSLFDDLIDKGGDLILGKLDQGSDGTIGRRGEGSLKQLAREFLGINNKDKNMMSYEGLYLTEDTGFIYNLPYLTDDYLEAAVNMTDTGPLVAGLQKGLDILGDIVFMDKPGTYIEQSKQVTLGENGRSLRISFPLLNTGTYEEISRNWQLIFALVFQSKHGRVSKALIEVPCIYEVFMEGVSYMPYAYMSNIDIQFLGSRRKMKINVPSPSSGRALMEGAAGNSKLIETIIPDAYQVNLTVTGLNPESRNMMVRALGDPVITVSERI